MKNLLLFLTLFFVALVISCTIQNKQPSAKYQPPVVIEKPGKVVPIVLPGTSSKDTVYKYLVKEVIREVSVTDTAALSKWWKNLEARIRAEHDGKSDSAMMAILEGYRKALNQKNNLSQNLEKVKEEKAKVEEKVDLNDKVIYEVPLIMYIMLATIVAIFIARQQYVKRKLERQIREIKCKYK